MADHSREKDWLQLFENLKRCHDCAYVLIEKAIELEEAGNLNQAILKYESGVKLIDEAHHIEIDCSENSVLPWEEAALMIQKMGNTRKEVLCRIANAREQISSSLSLPPSYEEATSGSSVPSTQFQTYNELGRALQELQVDSKTRSAHLVYSHDNVRMYFISADGTVSLPSEPQTLGIVRLEDGGVQNRPQAYLQVGEWIYPLFPGVSPCYRTEYGAFILPDVHSPTNGSAVGLILPEEADASLYEILNDILHCIVTQPKPSALRTGDGFSFSISQGFVKGAQFISQGLVKGAEKASGYMNLNTPRLIQNLNPQPNPSYISPTVSQGMQIAKDVSSTAVTATTFVAAKIGWATMALGKYLAPHIQQQGARLLSSTTSLSEPEAAQTMSGALQIAAGAVEGFGTVYAGLENSSAILASSLTNNTVKIVEHKYGQSAGQVTGDTLYTVGNVITATNSAKYFTPKGLVKLTAKQTGKAVVDDYRVALRDQNEENEAGCSTEPN